MPRSLDRVRQPAKLPVSLYRNLSLYALAASAAGVELLALAQPSEAEVVYTKVNQTIGRHGEYAIDLNHDGTTDFTIHDNFSGTTHFYRDYLRVRPAAGARVLTSWAPTYAAALAAGKQIDGRQPATSVAALMAASQGFGYGAYTWGRWIGATNKYLGFQFQINGEIHFGWARLSVKNGERLLLTTITGFAYETVPNKPIRAGQTRDDPAVDADSNPTRKTPNVPSSGSLGALALGAPGISVRRRLEAGETFN